MRIKTCAYYSCCGVTVLIAVTLIIVQLFVIDGLIRSQAQEGIVMTNQTYGLWGVIPGDTETYTIRNFTIFNFTNAHDFIYRSSVTPNFVQTTGFLYQEKSEFINYYYSDDDNRVNYDYWLHFDLLPQSRDVDEKFTVINVAPLGFWMQLGTTSITSFTLQGFGGLFVEMNETIKTQALGQGVSQTFLKTYDIFNFICRDLSIPDNFCWFLWNDRYYGLDNDVNLQFWVKAAYYKDVVSKQSLFQHFYPLPMIQFEGLLRQINLFTENINEILESWFCKEENETCNSYKFTLKQISAAGITNDPPPGSEASESICTTNSTCIGSPEIVTFLHHEFKQKHKQEKYQNLKFSLKTFEALFTPYEGLLNIGTLNQIYELGESYDATQNEGFLSNLRSVLHAETNDHAFVIWEWIKYMTEQFVLKIDRGGSRKIAGLGGVFSQAWYQVSYSFADWFLRDAYSFLASREIGTKCLQMLNFLGQEKAQWICKQNIPDPSRYQNYYNLVEPCLNYTRFYEFAAKYDIDPTVMQTYCDIDEDPSNIGLVTIIIMEKVFVRYNCTQSMPAKKCTQIDIIVKQLFNSTITLNPLDIQGYKFYKRPAITANTWNNQIPTFEYKHYLALSGISDAQQHLESEVRDLFTFDKLLNGPEVQELFILDNDVDFYHKYHWVNPDYLRNYIRYVVIQVGFGGFVQKRSAKQLFFGYDDPFLRNLKQTDTMAGGDPSIQSQIAFNELNMTREEAIINKQSMFTGANDTKLTRLYHSLFNKTFITFNKTYFDGSKVGWEMTTPWAENVELQGSDGFSVPPNIDKEDTPPVYISSIARFANVVRKQSLKKYDMELWDMRISETALQSSQENAENAKYFQGFRCFLNSSYQGFPLFISKNHFLDAEPKWASLVTIVDERGNEMTANDWDDTRLYIQPYTGTAFSALVYLQSNYLFSANDVLFPSFEKFRSIQNSTKMGPLPQQSHDQMFRMLPIVNTLRSGNISDNAVDKYFGDLRDIINNKRKIALAGWVLLGLCFTIIIGVKVEHIISGRKTLRNQSGKKQSLLESQANSMET